METTLLKDTISIFSVLRQLPGNYLVLLPNEPDFTIVEVSEQFTRSTFTNREEILGRPVFEVFPNNPSDPFASSVENLTASLNSVIATGQTHEMPVQKYNLKTPGTNSYTEKYWMPVNKPVIIEDKIAYIVHSVEDITENRLLKLSETYFKALADDTPFMVWRSVNGSCNYVNKAWLNFTGLTFEGSLGINYLKAIHPDDVPAERDKFIKATATLSPYESKYRLLRHDGQYRWTITKASPLQYDGSSVEFIGSIMDITEQEEARLQVEDSERQFRQMADSVLQIIWITNAEGMHEYFNQRWYDFTGASYEQTQGEGWTAVFHPDDQQRAWNRWQHSLTTGQPYEIEYRLRNHTGEYVWVLGRAAPYYDNEGNIIKWFGTCTDIHEQKLLQQQKEEFISVASHELRTPLTSLSASLQLTDRLLKKDDMLGANPIFVKMISSANANVKKLNNLVGDLLNVTKMERGQLVLHKTSFNIYNLVNICSEYHRSNGIIIDIFGDTGLEICADEMKVEQVLINLINNAVKYAPESKEILINILLLMDDGVKVSVQDKGKGISKEKIPYLFDRYYRADNQGQQYTGLGLGLYICNQIIAKHNGRIGVDSTEGQGSTFWFTLPVK